VEKLYSFRDIDRNNSFQFLVVSSVFVIDIIGKNSCNLKLLHEIEN
jgi:hypothetical protein